VQIFCFVTFILRDNFSSELIPLIHVSINTISVITEIMQTFGLYVNIEIFFIILQRHDAISLVEFREKKFIKNYE